MLGLVGQWEGRGVAIYPSIETTQYREVLTVQQQDDIMRLAYEQKTFRMVDGEEQILHWESGFIRHIEDGAYEWINAQNNGRVEVMTGTITQTEARTVFNFETQLFGNDDRMLAARRVLTLRDDTLDYQQSMSIAQHKMLTMHLKATLKRN